MDVNETNSNTKKGIKRKLSNNDESRSVMPKYGNEIDYGQEKYDSLTDDVLIRIIKSLPIRQWPDLELVDRKFQRATHGAWRSVQKINLTDDFSTNRMYEPNEILKLILEKLLNRSPYLTSISEFDFYSGNRCQINKNTVALLAQFNYFRHLSISNGATITITDLTRLLETSKSRGRLKELDIITCYESIWTQSRQLDKAIGNVPDQSTALQLEKFRIELRKESETANPSNFFDFLNGINVLSITKLDLLQCDIDSNDLAPLIGRCVHLENLAFTFFSVEECQEDHFDRYTSLFEAFMVPENLIILSMGFKKLKWDCSGCRDQICSNSDALFHWFSRHRRITELSLIDIGYDGVIAAVEKISSDLTSLRMSSYGGIGDSVMHLIPTLVNLKKLRIYGSVSSISSDDFDILPALTIVNKQLECLYLDNYWPSNSCGWDSFNFTILTQFPNLKELRIRDCSLKCDAFDFWKDHANWKLESLAILNYDGSNHQNRRAEDSLLSFLQKMPELRRLDLSRNEIMDSDLEAIAQACPLLIELKLNNCKLITTEGVQKIIDGCRELKRIEIPYFIEELQINKYRNLKLIYNSFTFFD